MRRLAFLVIGCGVLFTSIAWGAGMTPARRPAREGAARAERVRVEAARVEAAPPAAARAETAPPATTPTVILGPDAAASFTALSERLGGRYGIAVGPLAGGPIDVLGTVTVGAAWSTSKVAVLATRIRDLELRGEPMSSADRAWATAAIERSDNAAIAAIFSELERAHGGLAGASLAVQAMLRRAGDPHTVINTAVPYGGFSTYGQTRWSTRAEVVFFRALARGRLIDPAGTAFVLGLMSQIAPAQWFGVGAAGYPAATRLAFKGGWGPDPDGRYLVRQTAIVGSGSRGYVVALLAYPQDGTFASGVRDVSALASWVRAHVSVVAG